MPGRKIDPVKAERARVRLRKQKARRDTARERYMTEQDKLFSEAFKASRDGATYVQIAEDLGVSKVYVHKILSEQRELRSA